MAKNDLKLLGLWTSPYVNRVEFALNLKGITDYEFLPEKLSNKSELLLKSNPIHKKIPVLIHNGKPICESLMIIEYIDEVWTEGPSILPVDPYDRAMARFLAAYIDDELFETLRQLRYALAPKAGLMKKLSEMMISYENAFIKSSKGKDYFGGDELGFVDFVLGSYLGWIRTIEILVNVTILDQTKTPVLARWADKFLSHNAVKDTLPTPEKLVPFHYYIVAENAALAASSQASK